MTQFSDNIRRRAIELGLPNAEVARRAGLSERRYGNYVAGIREPDLASLLRISSALGSSVDSLLASNDEPGGRGFVDRLLAAAASLPAADLEAITVQVEALAKHRAQVVNTLPPA